jgi:hypothetical protein
VGELRFGRLRVVVAALDAAARWGADGHRSPEFATGAVSEFGHLVDDLVVRGEDVVCELDLHHRAQAVDAHAKGDGCDAAFCEGGVEDAVGAVGFLKSGGDAKHATEVADVLTKNDDVRVALELQVQRRVEGCDHVHFRHDTTSLPKLLTLLLHVPWDLFVDLGEDR